MLFLGIMSARKGVFHWKKDFSSFVSLGLKRKYKCFLNCAYRDRIITYHLFCKDAHFGLLYKIYFNIFTYLTFG